MFITWDEIECQFTSVPLAQLLTLDQLALALVVTWQQELLKGDGEQWVIDYGEENSIQRWIYAVFLLLSAFSSS